MKPTQRPPKVKKISTKSSTSNNPADRPEIVKALKNFTAPLMAGKFFHRVLGIALVLAFLSYMLNGFVLLSNDRLAWTGTLQAVDGIPVKGSYTGLVTSKPNQGASPQMNQSIVGTPLSVSGKIYTEGIGTFSPSKIILDLAGNVKNFSCLVGMDARADDTSVVRFKIFADGEKVYESPGMSKNEEPQPVHIDLVGKKNLCLEVDPYLTGGCADWLSLRFER